MADETQTAVAEAAEPAKTKETLDSLLAQYVTLRENKTKMAPEDFDTAGRTLRRKIRAAGGSVNSLKPEIQPENTGVKKVRTKREGKKSARVEAGLDGDPRAQPAGLAHVNWLERIFSGQEQLPDDPQITPMEQKSIPALETSGEYGYGIDVLSDVLPRQVIAKFIDRFGYPPTWFALNKPESYDIPTALTLLILGPAPAGQEAATEAEAAPADAEAEAAVEEGDEVADGWDDEEAEAEEDE